MRLAVTASHNTKTLPAPRSCALADPLKTTRRFTPLMPLLSNLPHGRVDPDLYLCRPGRDVHRKSLPTRPAQPQLRRRARISQHLNRAVLGPISAPPMNLSNRS